MSGNVTGRTEGPAARRRGLLTFLWLAALLSVAIGRILPPPAAPENSAQTVFSARRALTQLREIAKAPHPSGSVDHARVRQYLQDEFTRLGIPVSIQEEIVISEGNKQVSSQRAATVKNIVARMPGTAKGGPALMLSAHYDSVPAGPGASDDGVGVVAVLETARALKAGPPLKHDVIFLLTDAEELILGGAKAFAEQHSYAKDVVLTLNFEARGSDGPVFMFETSDGKRTGAGAGNAAMIEAIGQTVSRPNASSLMYALYKLLPNDTDLTVFRDAGIGGLNFAGVGKWHRYHTPLDDVAHANPAVIQHHGEYALALARWFGNADLEKLRQNGGGDAVYFDILGFYLVRYPQLWALPLSGGALLFYLIVLIYGFVRKRLLIGGFIVGLVAPILVVVGLYFGAKHLWGAIQTLHPEYLRVPWGDPYNVTTYEIAFVLLTVTVVLALWSILLNWFTAQDMLAGALLLWVAGLGATTFLLPGATYAFLIPIVSGTLALCMILSGLDTLPTWKFMPLLLLAAPPLFVWTILAHGMTLLMSFNMPFLTPVIVALVMASLTPFVALLLFPVRWFLPILALVCGVAFLWWGSLTAKFDKDHRLINNLFYALDANNGTAVWASRDKKPDSWVSSFLKENPREVPSGELLPWSKRDFRIGDAPVINLPPADVHIEAQRTEGDRRIVRVKIRSQRPTTAMYLSAKGTNNAVVAEARLLNKRVSCPEGKLGILYYAPPTDGFTLELHITPANGIADLQVDDFSLGLPEIPGQGVPTRPDNLMGSMERYETDTAMVRRTYRLTQETISTPSPASVPQPSIPPTPVTPVAPQIPSVPSTPTPTPTPIPLAPLTPSTRSKSTPYTLPPPSPLLHPEATPQPPTNSTPPPSEGSEENEGEVRL